ncbi:hypothetical protein, partial [Maridesulfovibrio zosterae]|uniref:hypothetical protein n=1 Tax=Maridesulfovibrio zosterae TaxID=82171 RepID=UPI0004085FB7
MKISAGESGRFLNDVDTDGLVIKRKSKMVSPELESLEKRRGVTKEIVQRAYDREDEERDLFVLDAYNRFESGIQELLNTIMQREAEAAQSSVFEVKDYFMTEGGRIRDELPDDACRELFMDILASRQKTAIKAVAQHQSQEYQSWKERTAAEIVGSVLKSVNISPDAATLMHGERLLEGAVLRLYRGSSKELLAMRLASAKQAMYCGALETIGSRDPITALIVADGWREQLGSHNYEILKEKFEPQARNQSIKMEFHSLRNLEGEELQVELNDIVDQNMRDELADMITADRLSRQQMEEKADKDRINLIFRELFQRYMKGILTVEDIIDSGLSEPHRSMWRSIFSNTASGNEDTVLLNIVKSVVRAEVTNEYQVYAALTQGLGKADASLLATLFNFKDHPESKLIINGLQEISESVIVDGGNDSDHAAAVRDFLHRVVSKVGNGEFFSITSLRNEVIKDYFGGKIS